MIENEKQDMMAERSEQAAVKINTTTQTGKILMTINNLQIKCQFERPDMIISRKDYEESGADLIKNYNNTGESCKKAIA